MIRGGAKVFYAVTSDQSGAPKRKDLVWLRTSPSVSWESIGLADWYQTIGEAVDAALSVRDARGDAFSWTDLVVFDEDLSPRPIRWPGDIG